MGLAGAIALASGLLLTRSGEAWLWLDHITMLRTGPGWADADVAGRAGLIGSLGATFDGIAPYVLHVFTHHSWSHTAANVLALVALGGLTHRFLGVGWRASAGFLAVFFVAALGGGLVEAALNTARPTEIAGASSGVAGLAAGALYVLIRRQGRSGARVWFAYGLSVVLVGAVATLSVLYGPLRTPDVAWGAHLGGLVTGAFAFPIVAVRVAQPVRGPGVGAVARLTEARRVR